MGNKAFWESKTIWTSFIIFVASILVATGVIQIDLSPDATWIALVLSIIQFILRLVTGKEIIWSNKLEE